MTKFRLIRTKRRTVSLTVARNGAIEVRAPLGMPEDKITAFVEKHASWIAEKQILQNQRAQFEAGHFSDETQIRRLQERARLILPQKTSDWAEIMDVQPTGVRITSAKTRFGSCSPYDSICFSWRLMAYPDAAIDYVVVHELAHIRHKNHSRDFYAFVERFLPDWRERAAMLRCYSSQED